MSYKFLDKLERRFGRYAFPHLTEALIIAQAIFYAMIMSAGSEADQAAMINKMVLTGEGVLAGDWWRLFSFAVMPPLTTPLFAFIGWYLFWLYGRALDHEWGTFKYNAYLLIAYLATVAVAFAFPQASMSNVYIGMTVFLAFAVLYPNFELYLFFILPVKVKWLAWIMWGFLLFAFFTGDWATRWMIQASVLNFFLFFAQDIKQRMRGMHKAAERKRERHRQQYEAFHTCAVCGKTDKTDPDEEFRYCPECEGSPGFCSEHIFNHEHITAASAAGEPGPADPPQADKVPEKPKSQKREKW